MNEMTFVWGVLVIVSCLAGYLTLENLKILGRLDRLESRMTKALEQINDIQEVPTLVNDLAVKLDSVDRHVGTVHEFASRLDNGLSEVSNKVHSLECYSYGVDNTQKGVA